MQNYNELKKSFERVCDLHREANANEGAINLCDGCRYSCDRNQCFSHWLFDVLNGEIGETDKLFSYINNRDKAQFKEELPKRKLPTWVRADQWIRLADYENTLRRIVTVTDEGVVLDNYVMHYFEDIDFILDNYIPVTIRPYRIHEAMRLIGKTIKFSERDAEMVTAVRMHDGKILINEYTLEELMDEHPKPLVDGMPFGVAEVDLTELGDEDDEDRW